MTDRRRDERMTAHCPACEVAAALREHVDQTAAEWSQRRGALNFARIIAERACPDYVPAAAPEPHPTHDEPQEGA